MKKSDVPSRPLPANGGVMHSISWNEKAVEQAKAQGADNPKNATCPNCGTHPALRQFRHYECECGELQGTESRHTAWRG